MLFRSSFLAHEIFYGRRRRKHDLDIETVTFARRLQRAVGFRVVGGGDRRRGQRGLLGQPGQLFQQAGGQYERPRLVLFRGATPTACGTGQTAMGPFYCPGDRKVYIDLAFYDTLRNRLGAPGDFAQAYVIAHEVGHHVQNLLGITGKVDAQRNRVSEAQANALSVRVELQADCLAGVWANRSQKSKGWLDQSDIGEALNAASQIGDDTLQRNATGAVRPESFTHGSSAQRVSWFKRGLESGQVNQCNTFAKNSLG